MLGDGSMSDTNKNPVYRSQHSYKQHAYNCHKYLVLSEFVRTKPKKFRNYGFGKWRSCWQTTTQPALSPIASLCLRDGKKYVTQAWLNRLTWEGVAWWYQDDGGLVGKTAIFNTHGFTEREVRLLARWLTRNGVPAAATPQKSRRREGAFYWIIHLSTSATRLLAVKIRPYLVPEMAYKATLPTRTERLICHWCQRPFSPRPTQAIYKTGKLRPCCGRAACERRRKRAGITLFYSKPGRREARRAAQLALYYADHERNKKKHKQRAAASRRANPERHRAAKARCRAKAKKARQASLWTCRGCPLTEPRGNRHGRTLYCPECRSRVTQAIKRASASRRPRSRVSAGRGSTASST